VWCFSSSGHHHLVADETRLSPPRCRLGLAEFAAPWEEKGAARSGLRAAASVADGSPFTAAHSGAAGVHE